MQQPRRPLFSSLALRLALLSFLFNLAVEVSGFFVPLYARDLGASNLEVGLVGASYGLAYFLSAYLFGRQSDMRGRVGFIRLGLGVSALTNLLPIITQDPFTLLVARGAIGFGFGIASAATITYIYEMGSRLGVVVSYGALGWLASTVVAATLVKYEALFIVGAVAATLAFLISLSLKEERGLRIQTAFSPLALIRSNRKLYLGFLIRQLGANAIWSIFPLFLAGLGASKPWIAILYGINMAGQFILLRFVDSFDPAKTFVTGILLSIPVFVSYGLARNYLQVIPSQILLAAAWSCLFVGALNCFMRKNVERGTAVGLLYSTIYLSAGLGPFIGGVISQVWGFQALMYVGAAIACTGWLSARGLK